VWKAVGKNLAFSLLEEGYFLSAPACFFTSFNVNLKYLLAVLCSSYAKYFIYNNSDTTGAGDVMLNIQSLEKLPIPKPHKEIEERIIFLFDNIHRIKEAEKEIDRLINQMLDLLDVEMKFISSLVSSNNE
jgi:restriction endonuclease S subunit